MWTQRELEQNYYEWLKDLIPELKIAYGDLIQILYDTPFRAIFESDNDRMSDGMSLRNRYTQANRMSNALNLLLREAHPCSVLEVMLALALRIEEEYLGAYSDEHPVGQWFNYMLHSLGIAHMIDPFFETEIASEVIDKFLNHNYRPDGFGSLFWIINTKEDMRQLDLWHQAMLWINEQQRRINHE